MRCSQLQSRQPRRGQALLLAVLIMIFAALLSASFIAIVSVNLNQTARQTDKNRAVVSAKAGMDYVTRQLAYSNEGERWNPLKVSSVPQPTDPSYNFYYTALDRAQGWAGSYAKFPDPRNASGQNAGPQYLARVDRVPLNLPTTSPEFDKAGAIKVTVIGLSPEDPTAYSRSVAYFGGYKNAPVAQTMRTVSNWDFLTSKTIVAQADPTTGNGTTATNPPVLGVNNAQGDFSKLGTPFPITISNPRGNPVTLTRTVVVTNAAKTTPTTYVLTLAKDTTAVNATDRIEVAANLGGPIGIDYDNDSGSATPTAPTPFNTSASGLIRISDGLVSSTTNNVDGARVNASLVWSGDLLATKLRPLSAAFGTNNLAPGSIFASGVIAPDPIAGAKLSIAAADGSNADTLISSRNPNLFSNGIFASSANANSAVKLQMVSDAWDRLKGVSGTSGMRTVEDFHPPVIDSGAGVERYRNLTRFSKPYDDGNSITPALPASASLYGQGEGIYLDNLSDREKIGTGPDTQRDMTQSELVKMWLSSTGVTDNFTRLGAAELAALTTKSLEEQHLRGWVGPDEFRARGVEIELSNDSTGAAVVNITRDARDDNRTTNPDGTSGTTNALGPVASKVWKDATGTLRTGVYRETLPWPANGVIFAEGNVRIKGQALNAPRSLSVVSMNNIYIEDSLSADADNDGNLTTGAPRKVLLMAKKNVVMNPTRALGRPDAQTVTKSGATFTVAPAPVDINLDVNDVADFQIGDVVRASEIIAGAEVIQAQGVVKAIVDGDTLTITPSTAGSVTTGAFLKTPIAATQIVPLTAGGRNIGVNTIGSATDVMQRRIALSAVTPNLRLAFDHQSKRVNAFTAAITARPQRVLPTDAVYFSNKGILLPGPPTAAPYLNNKASILSTVDKRIRGQFTDPATGAAGVDEFPDPAPASEIDAQNQDLNTVSAAMNAKFHEDTNPGSVGWQYDTSIANPQSLPVSPFNNIPFFYLAGVGNRFDFGVTSLEGRKDINPSTSPTAGQPYIVPLANTIGIFANGSQSTLTSETYNLSSATYEKTNQFGFSPNYVTASSDEDVLTGDQSFYQTEAAKSTLDSRQLSTVLSAVPNTSNSIFLRQNDLQVALPINATNALNYPDYRVLGLKTEDVGLTADATTGSVTVNSIKSGHVFNVNAFVYAQTGSWFVIPSELFNDRLKVAPVGTSTTLTNTFLDANDNGTAEAGEFITDASGNGYPDLNRNGVIEDTEKFAMARYSRQNYAINFTGAISENQTALVNDIGIGTTAAKGAVTDWMNKWATTAFDPAVTPALTNDRIRYIFDPTVVLNGFQTDDPNTAADETDYGFRLPQNPEVFNVS